MASLGGTGQDLLTKKADSEEVPVEASRSLWDVVHPSEDELVLRQQAFDDHTKHLEGQKSITSPSDFPPTYVEIIRQLPFGFYFPEDAGVDIHADIKNQLSFPGSSLPVYDPAQPLPRTFRRPWHDTFRPPNGPPVFSPVSIGYGAEVGLKHGLQALWDPVRRTYFFVDHIQQLTFYEDPRPPRELPPAVPPKKHNYGDKRRELGLPPGACGDPYVVKGTAKRAYSKSHGFTLYACGVGGQHGRHGRKGSDGSTGVQGHHGCGSGGGGGPGGNGGPGKAGKKGERGGNATEASEVILSFFGDPTELQVTGTCTFTANLGGTKAEEVLLVSCRGGNGANGGRGGDGGRGGYGGKGGNGANGTNGLDGCLNGSPGGDGRNGGNGGEGGNGGPGGAGAEGGDGGHAGNGGVCILQATDPRLLVLVEADCMNGNPGNAGKGGKGGAGGGGGHGGSGGSGGRGGIGRSCRNRYGNTVNYPDGAHGAGGMAGTTGIDGPQGPGGTAGTKGNPAKNGAILWVVSSPDGEVLCQAGTRYDADVTNLKVVSAIDDGIFEPNERIMVSGIRVMNTGGLPLPDGASAFIPSTNTVKFEPTHFNLPEISSGKPFIIPITYHGRIFDQPSPNMPGPFLSTAKFHPRIELLGRPFQMSFLLQRLTVQYPVKLAYLKSIGNLGRGEDSVLEIGVHNISSMPYGSGCQGSGGTLAIQVHLDARLIPLGSSNTEVPYTVTFDPNIRDSLYIEVHEIPAGGTVNVQINIQMESRAELFDQCYWQADLYLRDKLIEYNFKKIRADDVLMVTDKKKKVEGQRIECAF